MSEHEIVTSGDDDLEISREIAVTVNEGRVQLLPNNFRQVLVIAKTLSMSDVCVPPAFRGNRGACLQVTLDALRVGASPFALINQAYVTKNKAGEERVAYMAQAIHAIVNGSKILKHRLRPSFDGEGVERRCTVVGMVVGEDEPFTYESPSIRQILVKNSPLWISDPDQQLAYYSTRAWARRYVPEVILGMFTPDDLGADPVDVTPPPDVSNFFPPPNGADQDGVIDHDPNGQAALTAPTEAPMPEIAAEQGMSPFKETAVTVPTRSQAEEIQADRYEAATMADQVVTRPPAPPPGEQPPAGPAPRRRIIPHRRTKLQKELDQKAGISDAEARRRWREQHPEAITSPRAAAVTSDSYQSPSRQEETLIDGANDPPPRASDEPEPDESGDNPAAALEQDSTSFDADPTSDRTLTHELPPWVGEWWEEHERSNRFEMWMDQRTCATDGRDQLVALALGAKSTGHLTQFHSANFRNIKTIEAVSISAGQDVIAAIARRRAELQGQR